MAVSVKNDQIAANCFLKRMCLASCHYSKKSGWGLKLKHAESYRSQVFVVNQAGGRGLCMTISFS